MRMLSAAVMLLAATLSASAQGAVPPDVIKDLAPTGKLRAAINFGNGVLAQKGPNGEPRGITPDLATALINLGGMLSSLRNWPVTVALDGVEACPPGDAPVRNSQIDFLKLRVELRSDAKPGSQGIPKWSRKI